MRRTERARPRVVIADDDPLSRHALKEWFQAERALTVVADTADGVEALELAVYYRPDILIAALDLERLSGMDLLARVRERAPEVRVVFLSVPAPVEIEIEAVRAGACAFLSKDLKLDDIRDALRSVARGEAAVSPEATAQLVDHLRALTRVGGGVRPVRSVLTPREWQVVDMLGAGSGAGEIAEQLDLSPDTVRTHIKNTMRKLEVRSVEAIVESADRLCREAAAS